MAKLGLWSCYRSALLVTVRHFAVASIPCLVVVHVLILLLVAVGGIALFFQSLPSAGEGRGFGLMAAGALTLGTGIAFLLGLPTFFVTIALMRGLRSLLEPKPAAETPLG